MEFKYCAFIDRRAEDGLTDFTDLPFDDLNGLRRVAEAALLIPYVSSVAISEKDQDLDGKPWWRKHVFERDNPNISGHYTTEENFRGDLRAALRDDNLFEAIYRAKQEFKGLMVIDSPEL